MVPGAIEIVAGANGGIVRDEAKAAGYVHSDCGTAFPFTHRVWRWESFETICRYHPIEFLDQIGSHPRL